jgi:hypothetical protein
LSAPVAVRAGRCPTTVVLVAGLGVTVMVAVAVGATVQSLVAGVPGSVVTGSVGVAVCDGASVEGAGVGATVSSTTAAACTATSTAAASCDDDTAGGLGAGGSVMVGWSPPITTVLPSDSTASWTVGALEGPGAPV